MMRILRKCFLFFAGLFLLSGILHAHWNQNFDQQTQVLLQDLPDSQKLKFSQQNDFFIRTREKVLADSSLRKKIKEASMDAKFIIKMDNLIIKKRKNDKIHDAYAWEFSCCLGNSEFVVPSFPVEIAGKKVILQKKESFQHSKTHELSYFKTWRRKISVETYWKAHFIAYLLGHHDLLSRNIGVNSNGMIRFFDNEACFFYLNNIIKSTDSIRIGFISQAFDWPQFIKPLDRTTAESLKKFVQTFANSEEMIKGYKTFRSLPFSEEDFLFRLEKVRNFAIQEGATFRDFFGSLYPRLNEGFDELIRLTNAVMKRKMNHGSSLFFISRWVKKYKLINRT